jgi:RNA-directed DNA polymerase
MAIALTGMNWRVSIAVIPEPLSVQATRIGGPGGGVLSHCLANVYLHRLARQWADRGTGVPVRYADDLPAMCRTGQEAERALSALTAILAGLGLELKPAKTRIVHLEEGGEARTFSAFTTAGYAATPRARGT